MGDVSIEFDEQQIRAIRRMFPQLADSLPRMMAAAVNQTATATQRDIARAINRRVYIRVGDIRKHISKTRASRQRPEARVRLSQTERISLKRFGARQTRRGVSYRISRVEGRKRITSAFTVERLGGHVYKRRGAKRYPIDKLQGPSPWGVFVVAGLGQETRDDASATLSKQLDRRVRAEIFKRQKQAEARGRR